MTWFAKPKVKSLPFPDASNTQIFDENTFYRAFIQDLATARQEVIIDSPYITIGRLRSLKTFFEKLVLRGVKVVIITKHPSELDSIMAEQLEAGIVYFEKLGVQVLLCKDHHRKLAMIDRNILWEGSLNILSQTRSREIMRRIDSKRLSEEMYRFLKYDKVELYIE
jgi:phosphatidylserine/phosphatidylglycerophosphate/cardiolipin synthase-like enzyme